MELNSSDTFLFLTTLISAVILAVCSLISRRKPSPGSKKKRPPGPWRLPLIGNLLHLATSQPHVALRDLAMKHGPVMYLRLGQVDAVVISSPAAAQEVLRDKDTTFASRPSLLVADIILYGSMDMSFAPYGAYWRMLRKLCMSELLNTHKVRQLAAVRDSETLSLVRKVVYAAGAGGGGRGQRGEAPVVNLGRLVLSCSMAITGRATLGKLCGDEIMSVVDVAVLYGSGFCAGDLFPSLWFVDVVTGLTRRLWTARRRLDAIFDRILAECEARQRQEEKMTGDDGFLGVLLRIRDDDGEPETGGISTTSIKAILFVSEQV